MKMLLTAMLCLATGCAVDPARADAPLRPPPGFTAAVGERSRDLRECPRDAVPFAGTLDFPSKYEGSGKARDTFNPRSDAEYRRRIAPITAFERGVSSQVDDYLRGGNPKARDCALELLQAWSVAGGLEGEATTHTGKSMRKWALGSVSASYLRLKFSSSQPLASTPPMAIADIESWMARVAEQVVSEWRDQPLEKINNHEYWAAWSVMAVAVALDRRDLFDWVIEQYRIAADQIDAGGYLPNELARDTRALYYHNYALTPLAMIAAFAAANGIDLAGANGHALDRLATRVVDGIDDPEPFRRKTNSRQIVSDFKEPSKFAWMEPYCWLRPCDRSILQQRDALQPLANKRLGGNVSTLFSGSANGPANPPPQEVHP